MTHLPDLQTWQVHWPSDLDLYFALHWLWHNLRYIPDLLNYKAYSYEILHSASPRCTDSAGTLTRWPWPIFCAPVTLNILPRRLIPPQLKGLLPSNLAKCFFSMYWLGRYLDCKVYARWYFGCSVFDIIYVNVPDLLKCKTSSHQTLHNASPTCTDLAGILTRWPWPIFCAPVPSTHFTLTFNISSTIRPTTIKPRGLRRYLDWVTLTYISLYWLIHLLRHPSICPQL